MTYVTAALRREVIARAGECCEYCLLSTEYDLLPFAVDHIIAEKHGGQTNAENLCLSCYLCNTYKGSDIGSIDTETNLLTPLFNPRKQAWNDHFRVNGAHIELSSVLITAVANDAHQIARLAGDVGNRR